ncbi:hypothetical protein [Nannocystis punicea]|uniref:Uncharacterized protein n=1 Tax=Nannocystis punicea TaxID=2995304 RepID=A0ABY7GZW7_9BACT|nr:hypothetical protein [Nannocystis poenicansa]WAS92548.1 hypothetical protein O0S08_40730 [Nannocystis poenicansa]
MSDAKGKLIRQEEAVLLLDAIGDEKTRHIAGALFAALWRETRAGVTPACDFDLEFFVRIVNQICGETRADQIHRGWQGSRMARRMP